MDDLIVDDVVHLRQDVPELALVRGERGVIRSTWFAPFTRYEVEFETAEQGGKTRALLRPDQMEAEPRVHPVAVDRLHIADPRTTV